MASLANNRFRGNKWLVLSASALGLFMVITDSTVVNISIPTMIADLGADLSQIEWVLNAYTLVFAALLITFGRLGDMYGQRRMFLIGLGVFIAGSAACGVAPDPTLLILFRIGQAFGAAFLMPTSLSLVELTFPPHQRGTAYGVWGAISGFALGIGPTLGGFLTTYSWRYVFYINVPIGLFGLFYTLLVVPRDEPKGSHRLDWAGVFLSAATLIAFNFALIEGPSRSWDTLVIGLLASSAVLLFVFIWWERRTAEPLLEIDLFLNRSFSAGNAVGALTLFAMVGTFFLIPLFLQSILGFTPLKAGLVIAPMSLALMTVGPIAGHYSDRFGSRWFMFAGLLLVSGGLLWVSFLTVSVTGVGLVPRFIVAGLGMGLTLSPLTSAVMGAVPQRRAGNASGVLSTMRRVGAVMGIAVLGAVLQGTMAGQLATQLGGIPGVDQATAQKIVLADRASRSGLVGGIAPSADSIRSLLPTQTASGTQTLPSGSNLSTQLKKAYDAAFVASLSTTLRVASMVALVASLLALLVTRANGDDSRRPRAAPEAGG